MTSKFNGWPRKIIGHLFYTTSSFVHHFKSISEFKLELQSGNAQFGSKSTIFLSHVTLQFDGWPWKTIGHLFYATKTSLLHKRLWSPRDPNSKQDKRINECPKTACIYCDSMDKTGHIYSYTTKQSYESKFNICCQSSNLVYCLWYNTCCKQYSTLDKPKENYSNDFRNNIRKNHQNDPHWPSFQHHWTLRW